MPDAPTTLSLLSVVIPARNEEDCIVSTIEHLHAELRQNDVSHEIVVVDDASSDATWKKVTELSRMIPELRASQNPSPAGFGTAIIHGLDLMKGDAVVIMMADESDDCR